MTEVYRHPCALKTLHYILNFPHKLLRLLESLNAEGLGGFFSGLVSGIRIMVTLLRGPSIVRICCSAGYHRTCAMIALLMAIFKVAVLN